MNFKDLLVMCWRNLYRRKVRTILTVIGVVIGTCSIVVMVSLGVGLKTFFDADMESYNDMTAITVMNPEDSGRGENASLTDKKLEEFQKMNHVEVVSPLLNMDEMVQITTGQYVYLGEVIAMDISTMEAFGYETEAGKLTDNADSKGIFFGHFAPWSFVDSNSSLQPEYRMDDAGEYIDPPPVDVMTSQFSVAPVRKNMENTENAKDAEDNVRSSEHNSDGTDNAATKKTTGTDVPLNPMGLLKMDYVREGAYMGAIIPLDVGQRLQTEYNTINGVLGSETKYDTVKIKVDSYESVEEVEETIKAQGFTTSSAREFRDAMGKTAKMIQLILGGLGAISLFVAALGITNTMIMSIYERTREIGVMKVLGCPLKDIRLMFLTEAGAIGIIGGVIGIIFSYLISFGINVIAAGLSETGANISVIPFWLVLLGLGFSLGVGLISGFSPANRAVKISPLSAIRQD